MSISSPSCSLPANTTPRSGSRQLSVRSSFALRRRRARGELRRETVQRLRAFLDRCHRTSASPRTDRRPLRATVALTGGPEVRGRATGDRRGGVGPDRGGRSTGEHSAARRQSTAGARHARRGRRPDGDAHTAAQCGRPHRATGRRARGGCAAGRSPSTPTATSGSTSSCRRRWPRSTRLTRRQTVPPRVTRLDAELVRRGLARSREVAAAAHRRGPGRGAPASSPRSRPAASSGDASIRVRPDDARPRLRLARRPQARRRARRVPGRRAARQAVPRRRRVHRRLHRRAAARRRRDGRRGGRGLRPTRVVAAHGQPGAGDRPDERPHA